MVRDSPDPHAAVGSGVFTPLGQGCADIAGGVADLRAANYTGWVVTEQDILIPVGEGKSPFENARMSWAFLRELGI